MRKLNKLLAGASALVLVSFNTQASCVPANCNTLGYTKSAADCDGSDMIKCPFDTSKVWCMKAEQSQPVPGMILYSDGTISNDVISGKTPVGVVAYVDENRRFAVALTETSAYFSTGYEDVSCLTNYGNKSLAQTEFNGATNTLCMVSYNGSYSYPAAEYCYNYKPVSRGTGSSGWYLPAAGELYVTSFSYGAINLGLQKLSKTQLSSNIYYLSSSEYGGSGSAWVVRPDIGNMSYGNKSKYYDRVRCILAF